MDIKDILGAAATAIAFYSYVPYVINMYRGKTKPHAFSWFIWGFLTFIAFAAQFSDEAGAGAWVTGFTAFACLGIAGAAVKYGEKNITRSDWVTFIAGLAAIPLWIVTNDPLWAVVLVTFIDIMGFWPTFRKSWNKPQEETLQTYIFSAVKFVFSLAAMDNFSLVTTIFPTYLVLANGLFVLIIFVRRRQLARI